jgi:hypothetical protein
MAMQTDVKSGYAPAGTTTTVVNYRTRLKGIVIAHPTSGTVVITDGAGGPTLFDFTASAGIGTISVTIPGEGVLAQNGIVVTTGAATTVNVFYG